MIWETGWGKPGAADHGFSRLLMPCFVTKRKLQKTCIYAYDFQLVCSYMNASHKRKIRGLQIVTGW
jgi:hypothetical protein